ncbi:MAG: glycosyltransferase family 4 protein [Chloroflexi bacterium]|nr:glycosyltransferase family 4 protein [Chloroflexota bacterium]
MAKVEKERPLRVCFFGACQANWEGMMMRRPVITGDAETIREELTDREHLYLVERANLQEWNTVHFISIC